MTRERRGFPRAKNAYVRVSRRRRGTRRQTISRAGRGKRTWRRTPMADALCLHIDANDPERLRLALKNARNYLLVVGEAPVTLLANGPAVRLFAAPHPELEAAAGELAEKGLRIELCQFALNDNHLAKEQLWPCCHVVPAGMAALVAMQREGYAYVKP